MIPKNLLSSGTALFYIVVDAGLLPINASGSWGKEAYRRSLAGHGLRFGDPACQKPARVGGEREYSAQPFAGAHRRNPARPAHRRPLRGRLPLFGRCQHSAWIWDRPIDRDGRRPSCARMHKAEPYATLRAEKRHFRGDGPPENARPCSSTALSDCVRMAVS